MACNRPDVVKSIGYRPGACLLSDIDQYKCPTGWVENGFEQISRIEARKRGGPICGQDFIPFAKESQLNRFRKKCKKVQWNDANKHACCLGTLNTKESCAPDWCDGSSECNGYIQGFCTRPANKDNPMCACMVNYPETDKYGPAYCVDTRCTRNGKAKRIPTPACTRKECTISEDVPNLNIDQLKKICGDEFKDERPTESPSSESPEPSGPSGEPNYGLIGGIIGGVVAGGVVIAGIYYYTKK